MRTCTLSNTTREQTHSHIKHILVEVHAHEHEKQFQRCLDAEYTATHSTKKHTHCKSPARKNSAFLREPHVGLIWRGREFNAKKIKHSSWHCGVKVLIISFCKLVPIGNKLIIFSPRSGRKLLGVCCMTRGLIGVFIYAVCA